MKTTVTSKAQCRQAASTDRGPHLATLPGGITVRFEIPDSSRLALSGKLPERLRKVALICAAHPEGADGYMADVAFRAIATDTFTEVTSQTITDGIQLGYWLLAEMLVEPAFTPDEIESGAALPEPAQRMLLEFAERKRDTDADGNRLPIITLESMSTFRAGPGGGEGTGDVPADGDEPAGAVPPADGDPL